MKYLINAHKSRKNMELMIASQYKRLISASKKCIITMIQPKEVGGLKLVLRETITLNKKYQKFQILYKEYNEFFQDSKGLPPKRPIQYEIQLMLYATLPNIRMNKESNIEKEVKRKSYELLDQGVIKPNISPYGSVVILVPYKDGSWRMCINY